MQCARQVDKGGSVAGDDTGRSQGFNQIQRVRHLVKCVVPIKLRKHHTKTALPQRVSRHQRAAEWFKQDHRMGVVTGRGMHLPQAVQQAKRPIPTHFDGLLFSHHEDDV